MIKKDFFFLIIILLAIKFNISICSKFSVDITNNNNYNDQISNNDFLEDKFLNITRTGKFGILDQFLSLLSLYPSTTLETSTPSPPSPELIEKLDDILTTLNGMSNTMINILQNVICGPIKQSIIDNIQVPLQSLLASIRDYYKSGNQNFLSSVRNKCQDSSKGVEYIYSKIIDSINIRSNDYIQGCEGYSSRSLDVWSQSINNMAELFASVYAGCEKLFDQSTFDLNKFRDEIPQVIDYHKSYGFPLNFVRDQSTGLKERVKNMLNQGLSAYQIESQLVIDYSYLKWQIIRYVPNKNSPFQFRYSVGAIEDENTSQASLCGSIHWMEKLQNGFNALVAWCADEQYNNDIQLILSYESLLQENFLSVQSSVQLTQSENSQTDFNYIIAADSKTIENVGNMKCDEKDVNNGYQNRIKICASKKANFQKEKKYLSSQSIMFTLLDKPTTATSTIANDIENLFVYLFKTSVSDNPYKTFQANQDIDCRISCKSESVCFAASATNSLTPGLNIYTCRLYNKNQITTQDSNSAITFVKTIKYKSFRTYQSDVIRLGPNPSNCWKACLKSSTCIAISFTTTFCFLTDFTKDYTTVSNLDGIETWSKRNL